MVNNSGKHAQAVRTACVHPSLRMLTDRCKDSGTSTVKPAVKAAEGEGHKRF